MKTNLRSKIIDVIQTMAITYLSMKMICFAIPKFLFMQFRNLHYNSFLPLGEISKIQHMWSFFGRSYNYNLFIGMAEFLIGILIVFKRTRLIALLLSVGVCSNILILNIEFDADFALYHAFLDFLITVMLLLDYRIDLYQFFVAFGGKLKSQVSPPGKPWLKKLVYIYVIIFPIGYFIFAYQLRSTVDEKLVGSYQIKTFQVDGRPFTLEKGMLGSLPMIFFEHNNTVVLSINKGIYFGRYENKEGMINMKFNRVADQQIKAIKASFRDNKILKGKMNDSTSLQMEVEKLPAKKDYMNNMYAN